MTLHRYKLQTVVRTHMGANNDSYNCVIQEEDSEGKVGVHLSKDLMHIAGYALKANITALGPRVLPLMEKLRFVANLLQRKVCLMTAFRSCCRCSRLVMLG